MTPFSLSALISAIIASSLGIFVVFKERKSHVNISFCFLSFSIALWSLGLSKEIIAITKAEGVFWGQILRTGMIFIPPSYFYFAVALLNTIKKKRFLIYVSYFLSFIFLFLNFRTTLLVSDAIPRPEFNFNYWAVPNVLYPIFLVFFFGSVLYSIFLLTSFYKIVSRTRQNQFKYVLIASAIGFIGGSSTFLPTFNINVYPILNYFFAIYTIITAYAITKHRLMNISVVISRTLAWFLTILFYGGIYTTLMVAHRTYISINIGILYWVWTIIYGVLVGHNFQRTRLFLQTTTDRAFIKGWYDYRHVLRKIAAELGRALTRQDIVKTLYPILQDDIDIAEVDFYFLDEKNDLYSVLNPMTGEPSSLFLDKDNPLVKQAVEQKDVAACDGKLCVPSFSGDTLLSLFVLGKKRSGDEYTDDDIELFKTISEYVSIALEYIVKPYEEVRDKFEATERKLLETERQLERSERLASLGTLTAGIAHEIRNPLGIIHSTAEELTDKLRNMQELEEYKKSILRNTKRITTIITNMLNMAKTNEKKFSKLDVNKIVEDSLKLVTINGIKIVKELQPISKIVGDEDEIKQIMINLCANAVDAMPHGGELKIKTYQIEKDVYIEVSYTGIGITKENQAKIFDPFFSTRHEGSGLGLSIVYRIVKEHGGDVKVKSDVGRGATFSVKFTGVE